VLLGHFVPKHVHRTHGVAIFATALSGNFTENSVALKKSKSNDSDDFALSAATESSSFGSMTDELRSAGPAKGLELHNDSKVFCFDGLPLHSAFRAEHKCLPVSIQALPLCRHS
jgi:hypothetical protein